MKKITKILGSLTLSSVMVFAAVSCGGGSGTGDNTSASTTVKIMFHVDAQSAEGKAYKKIIDSFNAHYKEEGIKASASYIARTAGATDYEQRLIGMQNEGTLPDIITFDAPNCASYANSDLLYDLSSIVSEEIKNDFLSLNSYNGKLYGLPIQESSAGIYYNKALLDSAGVDVSSYTVQNPWTYSQFKDVCASLKAKSITPVDMRLDATTDETATYLLYPFIYASGGKFVSDDGLTATGYYDSETSKAGFQFLKDLVTEGYTSYAIGATDFFDGRCAMYLSSGWTIPDIDNKYTTTFPNRDSWGILPYPKDTTRASATGSWSYGITNNNHTNKTNISKLLLWLISVENSVTVTNATGMIPARKSVETNYALGSPESILLEQLSETGMARPVTIGYPAFSTNFRQTIYEMKDKDLATVLTNKASSIQSELNKFKK